MSYEIAANRHEWKWSRKELVGRVCWAAVQPVFRFSPRPFWGWRTLLLRVFRASIGRHVHLHPTVRIAIPWNLTIADFVAIGDGVQVYNLGPITIGERTCVSQGAHLCAGTHDYRLKSFPLVKSRIDLGRDVWVGADAFIGPGVTVSDLSIVGARAVVTKDVSAKTIVAGNPARFLKVRAEPI